MAQQLRHRCEGVELVGMGESEKGWKKVGSWVLS